ncbi:MAG: peptidylprolyl isomerase [Patescibacteria group bacterium]
MNKRIWKQISIALILLVILFFSVIWIRMRFFASTDSLSFFVSKIIPSSVLVVNGENVNYKDYVIASRLANANIFLKDLIFFKQDKNLDERVFEQLLYRELLKEKADFYEIKISKAEKENAYNLFLRQFESKTEAKKQIREKYNLSLTDYRYFVIDESLLILAVENNLAKDEEQNKIITEKINLITEKIKSNEDFAVLAKEYSQDDKAESGGDLGWFTKDTMVPEVEKVLYSLHKNEIYPEAIKSLFGYHFVKLTDFKKGEEYPESDSEIRASQILIRKPSANSLAQEMLKNAKIEIKLKKLESCQEMIN